jgi:hypothetical protein
VNTSIIKELRMYLSQITKIAAMAGSGKSLFLLAINSQQQYLPPDTDIDKFIDQYRDKTELPLSRLISTQDVGTWKSVSSAE